MIQRSTIDAYKEVLESLGNRQRAVYALILENDGICNRAIKDLLGWEINSVTGRVMELREMNLVRKIGEYRDFGGRMVLHWHANDLYRINPELIRNRAKPVVSPDSYRKQGEFDLVAA